MWAPFTVVGKAAVLPSPLPRAGRAAPAKGRQASAKPRPKGSEAWTEEIWKRQ